eukprot:UN05729
MISSIVAYGKSSLTKISPANTACTYFYHPLSMEISIRLTLSGFFEQNRKLRNLRYRLFS